MATLYERGALNLSSLMTIMNRTAQEVFDIMSDRIRAHISALPDGEVGELAGQLRELSVMFEKGLLLESRDLCTPAATALTSLFARIEAVEDALRGNWHGVFLDGRNEHGSHVIRLPHRSIELEQDEAGDFLKFIAETILQDAETLGFAVGDAVVATFDMCTDEGFFSHYEYAGISSDLTAALYGSPEEQAALSRRATTGGGDHG
jgi:hypothetical protein